MSASPAPARDARDLSPEEEARVEKVMKLLALAERNSSAEEAASALAKAQEMLGEMNLDLSSLDRSKATDGSGRREEQATAGGQYKYQRDLWRGVAELNFCVYYPGERRQVRSKRTKLDDGTLVDRPRYFYQKFHRLVGRVVNTRSTRGMAQYLEGAIERICRERYPHQSQFFSKDAVDYRRGMADNICARLYGRRQQVEAEAARKRREDEARAAAAGVALGTAVTLASVRESEERANYDFEHGEGAWEARTERRRLNAEYWARQERKQAEYDAAHPEEVAAREKKERQRERANKRARERRLDQNGGYSYRGYGRSSDSNSSAYYAGYRRGEDVGLEPQAEYGTPKSRRLA